MVSVLQVAMGERLLLLSFLDKRRFGRSFIKHSRSAMRMEIISIPLYLLRATATRHHYHEILRLSPITAPATIEKRMKISIWCFGMPDVGNDAVMMLMDREDRLRRRMKHRDETIRRT